MAEGEKKRTTSGSKTKNRTALADNTAAVSTNLSPGELKTKISFRSASAVPELTVLVPEEIQALVAENARLKKAIHTTEHENTGSQGVQEPIAKPRPRPRPKPIATPTSAPKPKPKPVATLTSAKPKPVATPTSAPADAPTEHPTPNPTRKMPPSGHTTANGVGSGAPNKSATPMRMSIQSTPVVGGQGDVERATLPIARRQGVLPNDTIPRPKGSYGTWKLREALLLNDTAEQSEVYDSVQRIIRDVAVESKINYASKWGLIPPGKKADIYNTVRDRIAGIERYEQDWATEGLLRQYLKNKRGYAYRTGRLQVDKAYAHLKDNAAKRSDAPRGHGGGKKFAAVKKAAKVKGKKAVVASRKGKGKMVAMDDDSDEEEEEDDDQTGQDVDVEMGGQEQEESE